MYDSEKLKLARGDRSVARSGDQLAGERRRFPGHIGYAEHRPLDWAVRNFHSVSLVALVLRVPGGVTARAWWRSFVRDLFRPYRPELHYMRGPGPKWNEKHRGEPH
jgi:hypothetical protein